MKFYRPLQTIQALTFDLDDTLYDNREVIRQTTLASHAFLQGYHPDLRSVTPAAYQQQREALADAEPEIVHDVTEWRRRTVERIMQQAGLGDRAAQVGAREVMTVFAHWRSQITVPPETFTTLAALAQRWPLVAITNGNAEPHRFGLGDTFQFVLRAGPDGRAKPAGDMFYRAARRLGIDPAGILHVGDDLTTDVAGALRSGAQACWINLRAGNLMREPDGRLVPHLEITRLASLTALI
ncbi:5-amino-6-(5-phospho-D-ribitylamino)uracil phosphatase YigB [Pantoea sp. 1.19]|uniref:5-amino-6-(5-phospho-D-ribitylamino)uracil phosphatase YigB n=1 Tax=Pantoea sp. 1.19 TaxID=1925589 RepID=UPI000948A7A3|nr:5-amino-6-(5-phospho-D-ribitylamino)uracil phosphatase YigB [Pantoea sp. 1.19]